MPSVDLRGHYSWELLLDIDNSENEGFISREEIYTVSLYVSRTQFVRQLSEVISKMDVSFSEGAIIDLVDVSVTSGQSLECVSKIQETDEEHTEIREETKVTTMIAVGARSRLTLYRLVFSGPGVTERLQILSSNPKPLDDVIISCSYSLQRLLKDIKIVCTSDVLGQPDDSIQEAQGLSANINDGRGGAFIWLVPEWTTDPAKGATGLEVIVQYHPDDDYVNLAKEAAGYYLYLKMMKDSTSRERITNVKLWRAASWFSSPYIEGFQHWTNDINYGRGGDYLYLGWESIII